MKRNLARLAAALPAALLALPSPAPADGKEIELEGAELVKAIEPARGFVDDPFGFDGAGSLLLYVNADAAELARIVVLDLAQGARRTSVDISDFTSTPAEVDFAVDGAHYLVVSSPGKDQPEKAALFDGDGKVVRTFGPADDLTHTTYDGREVVSAYSVERRRQGKGPTLLRHQVDVFEVDGGKRVGKRAALVTNLKDRDEKRGFEIKYWLDGYTRAVGIKDGRWDAREDQRAPDYEAWLDLPRQSFFKRRTIKNVIEHTKRMRLLTKHQNERAFLAVDEDLSGLRRIEGHDERKVRLEESFQKYDHSSLQYRLAEDGTMCFTLQVDPVNPEAVARKRADRPWLDLYVLPAGKSRAVRKARLIPPKRRSIRWEATRRHWAVLIEHVGFDRGGKRLLLLKLD